MTADAVGGVWEYALELSRGLRGAGVEVVLAVMGPPPNEGQVAAATRAGVDLHVAPYRLEWMDDPWQDVAAAGGWLLELERRCGCDLVHLDGYAHAVLPFRGPKLVVGHSCVLSWWQAVKGARAPRSWDHYQRVVTAGLAGADHIVAPTRWMLQALVSHYGPLRGQVIHNGRRAAEFVPRRKVPLVLSAGRLWDPAKNAALLARVADRLPWPVAIAGSGGTEESKRHDAKDAKDTGSGSAGVPGVMAFDASSRLPLISSGEATWLGPLPPRRLAELLAEAAIYVSPARYEPFGLAVLEAALSGCALVLSDIPSLRELWRGAAVFVPPDDEAALAAALQALMSRADLTALWGRRARRRALRYSTRRMVSRHLEVYRNLLAAAGTPQPQEARSSCAS